MSSFTIEPLVGRLQLQGCQVPKYKKKTILSIFYLLAVLSGKYNAPLHAYTKLFLFLTFSSSSPYTSFSHYLYLYSSLNTYTKIFIQRLPLSRLLTKFLRIAPNMLIGVSIKPLVLPTYIIGHYNPSVRITAQLLTPLTLCALILCVSGGTCRLRTTDF